MNKFRNFLNKAIIGAGLVGALSLNGCAKKPDTHRINKADLMTMVDGYVTIANHKTLGTTAVYLGTDYDSTKIIFLENDKKVWNNAKLMSKDENSLGYRIGDNPYQYVYETYLFRGPNDEEVSLFGKEGAFYVGQNYNIEFYLMKPNQDVIGDKILNAFKLRFEDDAAVLKHNSGLDKDVTGFLNNYTRVKK